MINTESEQVQYFTEMLPNNIPLDMTIIPGGTFMMGAKKEEKGAFKHEYPQHLVKVPSFFMGKYLVTQEQWKAIAEKKAKIERYLDPDPSGFKGNTLPVERVSWLNAVEFCQRLSQLTGKTYRLPTEAEWEYACRAGTTTPFCFGETIPSGLANYNSNFTHGDKPKYGNKTTPVGQFFHNPFDLYDMHGNVWEWCFDDWHDNYEGSPENGLPWIKDPYTQYLWNNLDSKGLNRGNIKINTQNIHSLRGGSWSYSPGYCRSASRHHCSRDYSINNIGFRVVCHVGETL